MRTRLAIAILAATGIFAAPALADDPTVAPPPANTAPAPYQPVQFPMPPDSSINSGDTNVVGSSSQWYGMLSITSSRGIDEVHQYYDVALPSDGWMPLAALMTSDKVVLQYVNRRLSRAAIVTLEPKSLWRGTDIEVVVSPLIGGTRS